MTFADRVLALVRRYGSGFGITKTPAGRARLLAAHLEYSADLIESDEARPAEIEKTAEQIEAAFRAFTQASDHSQTRLRLIQAIADNAKIKVEDDTRPISEASRARARAEAAQEQYAFFFPELAMKLDLDDLAKAVTAWTRAGGRPSKSDSSGSKWDVINELGKTIGIDPVSSGTIRREWRRFVAERRSGKGGVNFPSF